MLFTWYTTAMNQFKRSQKYSYPGIEGRTAPKLSIKTNPCTLRYSCNSDAQEAYQNFEIKMEMALTYIKKGKRKEQREMQWTVILKVVDV